MIRPRTSPRTSPPDYAIVPIELEEADRPITDDELQQFLDLDEQSQYPVPETSAQEIVISEARRKLLTVLPAEGFAVITLEFKPTTEETQLAFIAIKPTGTVKMVRNGSTRAVARPVRPNPTQTPYSPPHRSYSRTPKSQALSPKLRRIMGETVDPPKTPKTPKR